MNLKCGSFNFLEFLCLLHVLLIQLLGVARSFPLHECTRVQEQLPQDEQRRMHVFHLKG